MIKDEHLQQRLNELFIVWKSQNAPWTANGQQVPRAEHTLSYVKPLVSDGASIIDIGCGTNWYKQYFENLVGIDPVTPEADINSTIEDYITEQAFDVAFCFGSIAYGSETRIRNQISKVVSLMKPRSTIFWRSVHFLPDSEYGGKNSVLLQQYKEYNVFRFTEAKHRQLASDFGYVLDDFTLEPQTGMYALVRWVRSN